ncbi:MAG TPA: hypothetical protein VHA73_01460 [Acidimicrobiales bacterium]|nr:hypothetical protein [Acidimicrobiales bacterium]
MAALLVAVAGLLAASPLPAGASPTAARLPTNYSFTSVSISGDGSVVMTGRVTYSTIGGSRSVAQVRASIASTSGGRLPSECGLPADNLYANRPAHTGDNGTLDSRGNFRFEFTPTCTTSFLVTFFATTGQSIDGQGVSRTYGGSYTEPPPPTTTTSTPGDTTPPSTTPDTTPDSTPGGTTPSGPTSTTVAGGGHSGGSSGGSGGWGSWVHSTPSSHSSAHAPNTPGLPSISGSRTQSVNPQIAEAPGTPDTYSPTLSYPEQDAVGQPQTKQHLAGDESPTKRVLNTRLLAGCAAGAMVAGLVAAQALLLNRRGRELEGSLPPFE